LQEKTLMQDRNPVVSERRKNAGMGMVPMHDLPNVSQMHRGRLGPRDNPFSADTALNPSPVNPGSSSNGPITGLSSERVPGGSHKFFFSGNNSEFGRNGANNFQENASQRIFGPSERPLFIVRSGNQPPLSTHPRALCSNPSLE
jgi:hypothetical protein